MADLRLGLVGVGAWGRNYARTIERLDGMRLAAAATRDWEKLLAERLDGVIIATPPATHLPIARRFVEKGVPVLIEKPLCLDVREAEGFRASAAGATVMVNHLHVYSAPYRELKRRARSVRAIRTAGGREGPFRPDVSPLWDWGAHDVAMILDLAGKAPVSVRGTRLLARAGAENWRIDVQFEGFTARAVVGNALSPVRRLEVDCEAGLLVYDDRAKNHAPLDSALESFAAAIRGAERRNDLDLAVSVLRVLDQAGTGGPAS